MKSKKKKSANRIPGLQKNVRASNKKLTPEQTMEFIESFKMTIAAGDIEMGSTAISLRIPNSLLKAFKLKALDSNQPYQSVIKRLMIEHLKKQK